VPSGADSADRYAEGQREPAECRKCGQPIWIVYHGPRANHTTKPRAVEDHLAQLARELPEEATFAALVTHRSTMEDIKQGIHKGGTDDAVRKAIAAFLGALTDGGDGGPDED
jgi:hypothetical protein